MAFQKSRSFENEKTNGNERDLKKSVDKIKKSKNLNQTVKFQQFHLFQKNLSYFLKIQKKMYLLNNPLKFQNRKKERS